MSDTERNNGVLEVAAKVLIRSFALSVVLLVVWLAAVTLVGDFTYGVHSSFFAISREQFALVNYAGMAITKVLVLVFFLLPYVAIRWVLASRKGRPSNNSSERESS